MRDKLTEKSSGLFFTRFLILLFLIYQNFGLRLIVEINWKVYFILLIVWFLVEIKIFYLNEKQYYFETFIFIGVIKVLLVLINSEFQDYAFYSPPDSQTYKSLAENIFECKKYSLNLDVLCIGEPYFKRGPTFAFVLTIFTLGGNLHASIFVLLQVLICALTFNLILNEILRYRFTIAIPIVFIMISINPLIWSFSRLILMETLGSFLIVFSLVYSKNEKLNFKNNNIWLLNLLLSLFLNIHFFAVVFFFYLRYFLFKKNNFKFILMNFFIISIVIFVWGLRSFQTTESWDFNPYTGCYLEKNIIESTEAQKAGVSIYEIRNSGVTYKLLEDKNIVNQDKSPETCGEFLSILPNYYLENFNEITKNYKNYFFKLFRNEQPCQYTEILCEKGYWFWLIGLSSKLLFIFSLLISIIFARKKIIYDILAYLGLLILVTVLVTADAPRMRVIFEPFFYLIIGNGLSYVFEKINLTFRNLKHENT